MTMTGALRTLRDALPGWSCSARHHGPVLRYYAERGYCGAVVEIRHGTTAGLVAACQEFDRKTTQGEKPCT